MSPTAISVSPFFAAMTQDIISYLEGKYPKIINPYNVTQDSAFVDFDYISKLKVSCVTPSDSIFPNTGGRKGHGRRKEKVISQQELHSDETPVSTSAAVEALSSDKDALSVYERIPEGEDCFAEGLCDETFDMKKIMRILLKLEMRGFIRLLPGGKVKRNK